MAIGEAGTLTTGSPVENAPINVTFDQPLTDPVIALTSTQNGGDPFTLRVVGISYNITGEATGFSFIIEEWEYLDGPHPAIETINWLAIEEGVHTLPDGRTIEAGTTQANHTNTAVALNGSFSGPPVILTSVMSNNDGTTVDSDPLNITASGFNVRLQEEEGQDNIHALETVGYIAIQPGTGAGSGSAVTGTIDENNVTYGLGTTFTNPIVLGETQTINGGDPANVHINGGTGSTVDMSLNEEQSNDSETNHINETVGIVAFEDGAILCFTPGALIATKTGPVRVEDLKVGDMILTKEGKPQPLRWMCRRRLGATVLAQNPDLAPVLIRKDAIQPGVPSRDMHVSPQHRMLIEGWQAELYAGERQVLVPAKALLNDVSVLVDHSQTHVDYIHLLFDQHQVIYANDTPSESLHAGDIAKSSLTEAARVELFTLFPELRSNTGAYGNTARKALTVQQGSVFARHLH
jgi:hypothetical protein